MTEKKKLNSDLSIDDLLSALDENENQTDISFISDPVYKFIDTFNLKSGKAKIKLLLLHSLYNEWNKSNKITKEDFLKELNKYFSLYGKTPNTAYVYLNKQISDVMSHIQKYKNSSSPIRFKRLKLNFVRFLDIHKITKGDLYIESDVFYHIYDTWAYKGKIKRPLSYDKFKIICSLFFDTKYFSGSELMWIGVDSSIKQHISTQAVTNWRQGRAKRGKKSKVSKEDEDKIIYPETQE